jgi:hypothetical protein
MLGGLVEASEEGTPQGGPLSPLLSNIVLDELDKELEKRGLCFVRYADDCVIFVGSKRAGSRVMESASRFIEKKLRLKVNLEKSAVDRPWNRKYLGFCVTNSTESFNRLRPLQHWVRRRLRAVIWKHWKNRRTRVGELLKRGVYRDQALTTGCARKGPWRMSKVKWVQIALPDLHFKSLGLVFPWI